MESYYVPAEVQPLVDDQFGIVWSGDNYRIIADCPDYTGNSNPVSYTEVNSWGYVVDSKTLDIGSNSGFYVGEGCTPNVNDLGTATLSRSLFDSPNWTPFFPFYFALAFLFAIWIFKFAIKLLLGRGYK